jgi:hypothetical protein
MAATLAFSDVQAALRIMYDDSDVDQTLKTHPLLAMLDREENFHDQTCRLPVKLGNPQGVATTLAVAQSQALATAPTAFDLTKVNLYHTPKIAGELVEAAASGGAERFLKDTANIIDAAKAEVMNAMGRNAYRALAGVFSQVSAGTSSPVTVTYPQDLYEIEVNQTIVFSPNADMSSPRSTVAVVTAVDKDAGTITYSGTVTALAVGDYIAVSGQTAVASGLLGWSPTSAPASTSFFGVNRTTSPYLAGRRINASQMAPEEVWAKVNAEIIGMAERPDCFFINPTDLANFEVGISGQRQIQSRKYDFGFDALTMYGRDIIPDPDCPRGYAFGVPLDTFKLYSLGAAPKVLDSDGNVLLRISNADDYEARVGARFQFGTKAPYALMTITLPT